MKIQRSFPSAAHAKTHLTLLHKEQAVVLETPLAFNDHYMDDLADEIEETRLALSVCVIADLARQRGVRGGPMS
jgi:hypothetical protein